MNDLFFSGIGGVLSADIAVPDHDRALRFYSRVLGTGENPLWDGKTLLNNLGIPIIGLGAADAEPNDLPLQWMPHIQVADVAGSAKRAHELGGSELMHSEGDDGSSQWAVLRDPNGAAFGVIPVVPAEVMASAGGGDAVDGATPVGRIAWLDLTVSDASATRDFYREVVGWSVQDVPMEDGDARYADYSMLAAGDRPVAGVCHARGRNAHLPPVWLIYLPVGDLAESVRRVEEEEGEIIHAIRREEGTLAFAVVRDPVGAHIVLTG